MRYTLLLALATTLFSCQPSAPDTSAYAPPFDLSPATTLTNTDGGSQTLSNSILSDSTLVLRVRSNYPKELDHIPLYKVRWFTDNQPATNEVIILSDVLPQEPGGDHLQSFSHRMRVFKIADSLLPADLEKRDEPYVFYIDKKLHATKVFFPDSLYGSKTNHYFMAAADLMNRDYVNPRKSYAGSAYESSLPSSSIQSAGKVTSGTGTTLYFSDRNAKVGTRTTNTSYFEDFYFKNTGKNPAMIYKVKDNWYSAGCRVELPRESVGPGSRGRIRVYYRIKRSGYFNNEISVYTNAANSPTILTISGTAR